MSKRNWQAQLAAPFPPEEIEWRIARSGKAGENIWAMCLAYVTSRAVMDRLDAVFGVGNWRSSVKVDQLGSLVVVVLEAKNPETGDWMSWSDGTGRLESNDGLSPADAGKGDISNALKRAAVQAGIGRYLYWLPDTFAKVFDAKTKGANRASLKDRTQFWWFPPDLPEWALPGGTGRPFEIKAPVAAELPDDAPEVQEEVPAAKEEVKEAAAPADPDPLDGVSFANQKAALAAAEGELTAEDFEGVEPSGKHGYTLPDVKNLIERGPPPKEEEVREPAPTEPEPVPEEEPAAEEAPKRTEPPTDAQMGRLKKLAVLFSENGYDEKLTAIRQKLAAKYTKETAGAAIKYMKEFLEGEGIKWEEDAEGN